MIVQVFRLWQLMAALSSSTSFRRGLRFSGSNIFKNFKTAFPFLNNLNKRELEMLENVIIYAKLGSRDRYKAERLISL